jgi:hypothetical protein
MIYIKGKWNWKKGIIDSISIGKQNHEFRTLFRVVRP